MKFNPNCKNPGTCEECRDRCIQDIAFLYGMSEEKQLELLRCSAHKVFQRGDLLFHEGDRVSSIVIIKQGQVKLSTYEADRTYPYSAVCLTTTYCCFVRRSDVESAISDPTVALRVIHMLSDKLHDANERSRILSISEPVKRIAAFLIYREKRSNEPYITLRLDDIAGSVGLRPETVSRNIRKLVSEGLIEKVGQSGFRIPDFERLNSFVED